MVKTSVDSQGFIRTIMGGGEGGGKINLEGQYIYKEVYFVCCAYYGSLVVCSPEIKTL